MKSKPGFTLVELLVVIAIISILAGLLLPTLKHAKDRAYQVKCLSNSKQIYLSIRQYGDDFGDYIPMSYKANVMVGSGYWPEVLKYNGYFDCKWENLVYCPVGKQSFWSGRVSPYHSIFGYRWVRHSQIKAPSVFYFLVDGGYHWYGFYDSIGFPHGYPRNPSINITCGDGHGKMKPQELTPALNSGYAPWWYDKIATQPGQPAP